MTNDACPNCGLYHNTGSCFPSRSPADTTMTDVDMSEKPLEIIMHPNGEDFLIGTVHAPQPDEDGEHMIEVFIEQISDLATAEMVLHWANTYDALSSRCDELERLADAVMKAGEQLAPYALSPGTGEPVTSKAEDYLKAFSEACRALTAYQRKRKGE